MSDHIAGASSADHSMGSNTRNIRAQLEQQLNDLVAAQHPVVRNLSDEMLSIPHIQDSVFYGFALRWPHSYIAYLVDVLSQSDRLPIELEFCVDEPHPDLQDHLNHFRTSAMIHLNRNPTANRLALAVSALTEEQNTEILTEFRDRLVGILTEHRLAGNFLSVLLHNLDAWLIFATDMMNGTETDTRELTIFNEADVEMLRMENDILFRAGYFPRLDELIPAFRDSRALLYANRGENIDMDVLALIGDPVADLPADDHFPGFLQQTAEVTQALEVPEDEQVFDFGAECVWCSAKLLQPDEDAAANPDCEVLHRLPCGHVVGKFCFEVANTSKCPMCSADV